MTMGNVSNQLRVLSAALLLAVACGGGAEEDDSNSEVPLFQGIAPALPAPPPMPAGSGGEANTPAQSPLANREVPNGGQDTPIVPPVVMPPPQQQPPAMQPPAMQPPSMEPPVM